MSIYSALISHRASLARITSIVNANIRSVTHQETRRSPDAMFDLAKMTDGVSLSVFSERSESSVGVSGVRSTISLFQAITYILPSCG